MVCLFDIQFPREVLKVLVLGVFHYSGREDSVENNENTVDSTIIKLLKGVNRNDLKEKLVEGFTVEKSGDIIERERERAKGIDNVGLEFEDTELINNKESYSMIVKKWRSPGKYPERGGAPVNNQSRGIDQQPDRGLDI